MRAETHHRRLNGHRFQLWLVVGLMLSCAWAAPASASSFDDEAHAKACKCGSKCRGSSCCCGSPRSREKAPVKVSAPVRADLAPNPCQVSQAPCGDPIAPVSTPVGSAYKVAALMSVEGFAPGDDGQPLVVPDFVFSTDRRPDRLDRPPRFVAFA